MIKVESKKDSWETGQVHMWLSNVEEYYHPAKRAAKRGPKALKFFVYNYTSILQDMQEALGWRERVLRRQIDWEEVAKCLLDEGGTTE